MSRILTVMALCGVAALPALGNIYTSSVAYNAATAGYQTVIFETYSSGFTDGQDISSGQTFDGITYTNFTGGYTNADITSLYGSFSGLSLGADNTATYNDPTQTFFTPGEGITLLFSSPVNAASVFFNVNSNSGNYGFTTNTGLTASTGSASYDTSTFVFAGITSASSFSSITLFSTDPTYGSYNVPEVQASATPEPSFYALLAFGLAALAFARLRFWRDSAATRS